MTQKDYSTSTPSGNPLSKRLFIGGVIGLAVSLFFILPVIGHPNPSWPKFWYIRPLLVIPFAGAMGGLVWHVMDRFRKMGTWQMVLTNILCILVAIVGMWMGIVLGLVGTMWH